jgi:hypothetical protein
VNQQGLVEVSLDNCCAVAVTLSDLLYDLFDFLQVVRDLNTAATVRILSWLDDPDVCVTFLRFVLVKNLDKTLVFRVIWRFNMEGKWNRHFKGVKIKTAVVVANVHKKSFFVCKVEVVFEFAVYQTRAVLAHSLPQEGC